MKKKKMREEQSIHRRQTQKKKIMTLGIFFFIRTDFTPPLFFSTLTDVLCSLVVIVPHLMMTTLLCSVIRITPLCSAPLVARSF
jgi:hypothetical protein